MPKFLPLLACWLSAVLPLAAQAPRPNLIFILADDLGPGDLGCCGQAKIRTPHIDALAREGLRFTEFYAGAPVCAPSRCTLLTGRHLGHAAVRDNQQEAPGVEGQQPMPRETKTLAQALQQAGYTTSICGKWGLGMPDKQSGPGDFGFDHSFGYLCQGVAHTFYPGYLWRNAQKVPLAGNPPTQGGLKSKIAPGGAQYSHDLITEEALSFVRTRRDNPFFLYLAYTIPHLSLQVPEEDLQAYDFPEVPYTDKHYADQPRPRAAYAAMVTRMDRDIGRLLAELKKNPALDQNTLVIFSSDNGPTYLAADTLTNFFNSQLDRRGLKGELYEGGIRTPMIARWPGQIAPGATTDFVGAFWDVLPTFCELAGATPLVATDGISFVPTLRGRPAQQPQHAALYWENHARKGAQAVRMGEWKAICPQVKGRVQPPPLELYQLSRDPRESHDVAAEHPEVVAKARAVMAGRESSTNPAWNF